jgi:hypothetical protein
MNEHHLDNGTLTVSRDDIAAQGDRGGVTCVAKLSVHALPMTSPTSRIRSVGVQNRAGAGW